MKLLGPGVVDAEVIDEAAEMPTFGRGKALNSFGQTKTVDFDNFMPTLMADLEDLHMRYIRAMHRTAKDGAPLVARRAPKAFGELQQSVHSYGTAHGSEIAVEAPHAEAVEIGSRPHVVPLEDLIDWVKLRGSLYTGGSRKADNMTIGREIKSMGNRRQTPVDAPERIAKRIQSAIAKHGTKPHWFVKNSLPLLEKLLKYHMENVK